MTAGGHFLNPWRRLPRRNRQALSSRVLFLALTLVSSANVLVLRRSLHPTRSPLSQAPTTRPYSIWQAIFATELLKLGISIVGIAVEDHPPFLGEEPPSQFAKVFNAADLSVLAFPTMLGLVQNALTYVALTDLPVAWYHAASQVKVITTAVFAILILRRNPIGRQMLALVILIIGTFAALYHSCYELPSASAPRAVAAVLAGSTLSGFTSVYHEKALRVSRVSVCIRNAQLGILSAAAALLFGIGIIDACSSGPAPRLFAGFDRWTWSTIVLQATSGLLVAHVLKSAGAIVKNFSASLSIPVTTLVNCILLNTNMHCQLAIGIALMLLAAWMYTRAPRPKCSLHPANYHQNPTCKLVIIKTAPLNP
ncbi:hypothetical protein HDU89_003653 [Geranomyces variabilis]|nr:hypothetical protein HDU89_003653 [Geranomyces variabilis]